jgi:hypothetical protein
VVYVAHVCNLYVCAWHVCGVWGTLVCGACVWFVWGVLGDVCVWHLCIPESGCSPDAPFLPNLLHCVFPTNTNIFLHKTVEQPPKSQYHIDLVILPNFQSCLHFSDATNNVPNGV